MSQACHIFFKSTITLALTAAFCQVAIAQEYADETDDGFISLVKRKPVKLVVPEQAIAPKYEQDIALALASYPGVYVTTFMPNGRFSQISVGGSMPFGGAGIAIIEDGINHAPLAYLDNSLSNISMASVETIEALHSPLAAFGPNGLGGAINITGQQIPSLPSDDAIALGYGTHQQAFVDVYFGSQKENWGSLVSFNRQQGDSYRAIRNQQSDDYSANDFVLRIKEIAPPLHNNWQQTELKIQYKDYRNNESRFGISRDDLANNPMLRYAATALDNEYQEQLNIHLKRHARLANDELVTTDMYYNDGEAGYYQTTGVNGLFGDDAARALGAFEQLPIGRISIEKQALERTYSSWGVQFKVEQQIERHHISLGVRYHTESLIDQFWLDSFLLDSQFSLNMLNTDAEIAAYKDTARVSSIFLNDLWQSGRWDINVGVRHEKIKMRREGTNIVDDALGESNQSVTLLGGDVNYQLSDDWRFTLSGHQGYQPARSSTSRVKAQESQIIRGGISYDNENLTISAIAFSNDFDNLLGDCRGGIGCTIGEHNFGRARVNGAEVAIKTQWQLGQYMLPLRLAYTHNDGEFSRDFDSNVLDSQISNGDLMPYVPRKQLYFGLGVTAAQWLFNAQVRFRGVQRTTPGIGYDNATQTLDDVTLLNINASYQVAANQSLHLTITNVTDEVYAESSFIAGVLAGSERTISVSYKMSF